MRQSQVVVTNSLASDMSGQVFDAVSPIARDSGSQKHAETVRHADAEVD